jgi:hypothetical protein
MQDASGIGIESSDVSVRIDADGDRPLTPVHADSRCIKLGDGSGGIAHEPVIHIVGVHIGTGYISGCVHAERLSALIGADADASRIEFREGTRRRAQVAVMDAFGVSFKARDVAGRVDAESGGALQHACCGAGARSVEGGKAEHGAITFSLQPPAQQGNHQGSDAE